MKVKSESEVAQSCLTLSDPMDCSLPDSSIHGFFRQEYWSGVPFTRHQFTPQMFTEHLLGAVTVLTLKKTDAVSPLVQLTLYHLVP